LKLIFSLLAIAGGLAMGLQAVVNGGLGKRVGAIEASFISFVVGTVALFFLVLFFGKGNLLAISDAPKGQLIGGLLGAFFVLVLVLATPKIGVTATLISVIVGQLFIGSVIDHFGLFGGERFPLDLQKGLALLLMLASIYIFQK